MNKASVLSLSSLFLTLVLSLTAPAHSQGTYTTLSVPGASMTGASGINDAGQVVGFYGTGDFATSDWAAHGFLYSNGVYSTWDFPGATGTYITGVNNSGDMIGSYSTGQNSLSFIYSQGTYTTLSVPGASMTAECEWY